MKLAGVDGYKDGWVVASRIGDGPVTITVERHIRDVLAADYGIIALDIPIGLADDERPCDASAKEYLGRRECCVFHAPIRPAIEAEYDEAKAICRSRGVRAPSIQTWSIVPKIRQVDQTIGPEVQARLYEVYPEVSFCAMNHGAALALGKATIDGREMRRQLLRTHLGFDPAPLAAKVVRPRRVKVDDLYDALAALWTATRIAKGRASSLSPIPAFDSRNLRMEIWY